MDTKSDQLITCKNCGNTFTGNYCNICSQEAKTQRITWRELIHHLPHAILHIDGGIFYTIKEMCLRPGYTIKEYFDGKRVNHFNPFLFLIIAGGLNVFLYQTLHIKLVNDHIKLDDIELYSSTLAHKFYLVPSIIFLVYFTLSDYILYRKNKFILPEIMIFNVFCLSEVFVFSIICVPFLLFQTYIHSIYGFYIIMRPIIKVAIISYFVFARYQLFYKKGDYITLFKILVQIILLYASYEYLTMNMLELFSQ